MRTRAQKQHDALATALSVAARSGELPTLGGAAPTLVVSVRAADLAAGTGYAHLDGADLPVPIGVARHTGCDGVVQRVAMDDTGRIVSIGPWTGSSTTTNAKRSPSATGAASSPAATSRPPGARSTTSPTTRSADPPTPTTASCSAGTTTAP